MRTDVLCSSVLRVASGPRVNLAGHESALEPRQCILLTVQERWSRFWSYSLMLCGLFYEAICFMSCLVCAILFLCFSVFLALRLPRLGKRKQILVLYVYVCSICASLQFVWFCLFPLPLGVLEGLRFVIVALSAGPFFSFCLLMLQFRRDTSNFSDLLEYLINNLIKVSNMMLVLRDEFELYV